jgi:outer membrane protein assembly factor BamB
LSDEVSHICHECLQFFGNWVVALTAEGVLNGVDATSGDVVWSERLAATPRQLLNLSGRVGVPDKVDNEVGINVYDPTTGTLVERFVPECPNEVFPDDPQTLTIYDRLLVSHDGASLFVPISRYRPGCIQKWDATTLTPAWQASMPVDAIRTLGREPHLLTERTLYTANDHQLFAINLDDGAHREVLSDEDHNLTPVAAEGGIVVVLAERTRGSRKYSLWGVDEATGERIWEYNPSAQEADDGGSNVVHSDGLWSVGVGEGHVVSLEAFAEPNTIVVTALNPADGSVNTMQTLSLGDDDSSYWIQVLGWDRERVMVDFDGRMNLIDFKSGTRVASWP